MEHVVLKTNGRLYRIPRAAFEPISQTCERGWTIAELAKDASEPKKSEWIQQSFEKCYLKQGMRYD